MRVLIVDDEPLSRSTLLKVLSRRSDLQAVDSAKDGIEALELLEKRPYDILLLDIQMPELSGIDLAGRLNKRRDPLPSIIFVTAHHQHAVAAFERFADDLEHLAASVATGSPLGEPLAAWSPTTV